MFVSRVSRAIELGLAGGFAAGLVVAVPFSFAVAGTMFAVVHARESRRAHLRDPGSSHKTFYGRMGRQVDRAVTFSRRRTSVRKAA